ncbi:hypothetical protein AB0N73_04005 [Microbacterium sp. NPDC089189]|uniref:hypothetical protein n=1 Tax=Microbacterium sp. NPDC089189 TaxID=3154972 RepID=UPI00341DBF7C
MLTSEAAALGMAIEEMEKPAAAERQAATRFGGVPRNTTERNGSAVPKSRDIAAEAIDAGMAIEEVECPAADERQR